MLLVNGPPNTNRTAEKVSTILEFSLSKWWTFMTTLSLYGYNVERKTQLTPKLGFVILFFPTF